MSTQLSSSVERQMLGSKALDCSDMSKKGCDPEEEQKNKQKRKFGDNITGISESHYTLWHIVYF
jgi:hypothetical protein